MECNFFSEMLTLEIIKAEYWAHVMRNINSCEKDFLNSSNNVCVYPQFPQGQAFRYSSPTQLLISTQEQSKCSLFKINIILTHITNITVLAEKQINKQTPLPQKHKTKAEI